MGIVLIVLGVIFCLVGFPGIFEFNCIGVIIGIVLVFWGSILELFPNRTKARENSKGQRK